VEPFITYSEDRDLRKKAWELWTKRGELDVNRDNLEVAKQILIVSILGLEQHSMNYNRTYCDSSAHFTTSLIVSSIYNRPSPPLL
jgi:hypothetical protein